MIKGVTRTRNVTTVDASTLTTNGDGQATTHDGTVVTIRGNEITVTYDGNDVPMHYHARITEQYPNISRLRSSARDAGPAGDGRRTVDTGIVHDDAPDQSYDGGHAAGHQFFPGLGRNNMFPQESGFNRHVYTQPRERDGLVGERPRPTSTIDVDLQVTRHGGVDADAVLRRQRPRRATGAG